MASISQEVDVDTATIVAEEFGVTVTEVEPKNLQMLSKLKMHQKR